MADDKTLSLVKVFDQFCDSEFIRSHGVKVVEQDHDFYTIKGKIVTNLLGSVTLESVCNAGKNIAVPVMILDIDQVRILREHGIAIAVRKRRHSKGNGEYFCFPTRDIFEKIVSV